MARILEETVGIHNGSVPKQELRNEPGVFERRLA